MLNLNIGKAFAFAFAFVIAFLVYSIAWADKVQFLGRNDLALQTRLDLVENAKEEILLETYEITDDQFSLTILAKLRQAAERGVRVKILIDSFRNYLTPAEMATALNLKPDDTTSKNIEIRIFNPLRGLNFFHLNFRNHEKLFCIDEKYMIVGGRNIGLAYFGENSSQSFKDADVLVIGDAAKKAQSYFFELWNRNPEVQPLDLREYSKSSLEQTCYFSENENNCEIKKATALNEIKLAEQTFKKIEALKINNLTFLEPRSFQKMESEIKNSEDVIFFSNDPSKIVSQMKPSLASHLFSSVFSKAKNSLLISTPYLFPTESELQSLEELRSRGVQIQIVTNSLISTNSVSVHAGLLAIKQRIAQMGIELYLFKGPEMLHAKGFVMDEHVSFMGSFNLDQRSANINREMGIQVGSWNKNNSQFTQEFLKFIREELIQHSCLAAKDGLELDLTACDAMVPVARKQALEFLEKLEPLISKEL